MVEGGTHSLYDGEGALPVQQELVGTGNKDLDIGFGLTHLGRPIVGLCLLFLGGQHVLTDTRVTWSILHLLYILHH